MFKFVKRLSEPFLLEKTKCLKLVFESGLSALWFEFIPILFIPYLTNLVEAGEKDKAVTLILYLSLFYVFAWLIGFYVRAWDFQAKYSMEISLNEKYRKKIILKNTEYLDKIGTGKIQSIVSKGFSAWIDIVWNFLYQALRVVVGVLAGIYLTIKMGNEYVIGFVFLALVSGVGYTFFKIKQMKYRTAMNDIEDDLNKDYIRLIMSRQEVIFSDSIEKEIKNIKNHVQNILKKVPSLAKFDFLADLFVSSLPVLIPIFGATYILLFSAKPLETGMFLSLVYFATKFSGIMYWLVWLVNHLGDRYPELVKFWAFLDKVPDMDNYEKGARFVKKDGSIVFNKVSFAYFTDEALSLKDLETSKDGQTEEVSTEEEKDTENKNIFTDFHLEIKGGQKVAIVGKSGSGKTTLAKLVTGLLQPKQGQVFVDGQNMRSVSLKSYYKYVGYLTQEPSVFDGTIKENLLYAVDKKDLEKVNNMVIEEALRKAHCDFVLNMKKGLNTEIGEKGIRLSGGERQRLAIAKLFLKNPEIIILDEPTSALDSFSEDLITQSLEELFKGRTVIIIAHRLQTVKKADRILVLDSGRIVEDGDHESLVDKGGIYSKMLAMQSGF